MTNTFSIGDESAYRKLYGFDRSLLTDRPRRFLEIGAHGERQFRRIAPAVEQRDRNRLDEFEGPTGRSSCSGRISVAQFGHFGHRALSSVSHRGARQSGGFGYQFEIASACLRASAKVTVAEAS